MAKSDPLFALIHSLSNSEKRYFKVDTQFTKREKKYLLLFDAIAAQKEYNESLLRQSLKGERFLNELHVAKKYLFDLILKSLGKYFGNRPYQTVLQHMKEIDILSRKGLHTLALKRIEKVKRYSQQYQFLPLWLQVVQKEQILYSSSIVRVAQAATLKKEVEYLLDQITRKSIYDSISYASLDALYVTSSKKAEIVQIGKKIALLQKNFKRQKNGVLITVAFNRMNFNYYLLLNQPQKALPYIVSTLNILDENQHIVREGYLNQATVLHDYFMCLYVLSFKPAKEFFDLSFLRAFIRKVEAAARLYTDEDRQVRLMNSIMSIESSWTIFMGEYSLGLKLLLESRRKFNQIRSQTSPYVESAYNYYFMRLYFGLGEYSSALEWGNKLLSSEPIKKNRPIMIFTRIVMLVTFFELGDYSYVQQQLKTISRYINRERYFPHYQSLVLQSLKVLSANKKNNSDTITLQALLKKFRDLRNSNIESASFLEFEFDWWLESKITNTSFAEVVKKHRALEAKG